MLVAQQNRGTAQQSTRKAGFCCPPGSCSHTCVTKRNRHNALHKEQTQAGLGSHPPVVALLDVLELGLMPECGTQATLQSPAVAERLAAQEQGVRGLPRPVGRLTTI